MQKNEIICESDSILVKKKGRRFVTWTSEEDEILREQISTNGTENWAIIASNFKDKTTRQCRRRWYNYLNTDFKRGGWTPDEDVLLCEAQKIYGNRWTEIAKVVSGRTDNAVKNRFNTLCKKRAKNAELAKENNKRTISNSNGNEFEGSLDAQSPLKKLRVCASGKEPLRPPFSVLVQNIHKLDTLIDCDRKIEGTFLKKDDPKILALMQQAELLSTLANKVNTDNTDQSLDNAWKVLGNFLNKNKDTEELKSAKFEDDLQLDKLKDLVEELRNGNEEIQPFQRQPDLYDSPSSSEYSNGSTISTTASEQMEQTQPEMLQTVEANCGNTQSSSDNNVLAEETTYQEEIDEDISALLIAEFSSPLQITPLFRSSAASIPSPQFSESERHFLMKTLGIESPAPSKNTNPSQTPPCRRALIHIL